LRGDYDEQLAAAQRESDARANAATTEAEGLRGVATQERGLAYQGQQQAQAAGQEARRHIDEIGALAAHYAQREIDPDKWWKDKNVPQQIATVVGAMFAGLGGGAQAAMQFVNTRIDRSIALQQGEIDREGHALNQTDNLFGNFLKVSGNEQLAYDKTRAALLDSAMTDVAAAGKETMAPVQQAQIAQLMAAMKRERDMLLAKLGAARQAAGPAQDGWLEIDPKTVVRGMDGEAYHIDNPMLGDDVNNAVVSLRQLDDVLQRGQQLLQNRSAWQAANPYSDARQEGESLYKSAVQLISRFNSARGVPPGMEKIAEGEIPNFGDMTAGLHAAKIPTIRETIRERARETLAGNGARPIDVTDAPGRGKSAGKMTTYARPAAAPTAQAQVQDTKRTYPSATPR
jgi:hypothetical protein